MTLDVYTELFAEDLDSVAERLDVAAAQSRADSLRTADVLTLAEVRSKRASQGADLRKRGVGPVGLEPTTYGIRGATQACLEGLPSTVSCVVG